MKSGFLPYLITAFVQLFIWVFGGIGFLIFCVNERGDYSSVPLAIMYSVLCICGMVFAAMKILHCKFLRACLSPGVILLELAVLTGNGTPWVIAEPAMLMGTGNVALPDLNFVQGTIPSPFPVPPDANRIRSNSITNSKTAVIAFGGIGGGFDSPANGLYSRLSDALAKEGIAMYDIAFLHPGDLGASIGDVRGAVQMAQAKGADNIILIGHSFGGGAIVSAAGDEPSVHGLVVLSTQSTGCEYIHQLSGKQVLFVHGFFDYINPRFTTENAYRRAPQPKTMRFVAAGHLLDEASDEVFKVTHDWITRFYATASPPPT